MTSDERRWNGETQGARVAVLEGELRAAGRALLEADARVVALEARVRELEGAAASRRLEPTPGAFGEAGRREGSWA